MNSQPLKNEKQDSVPALITLDMAATYSLVRAREAERDLPPAAPDLRLHQVGRPIPELMLSQTSTTPPFLQLRPSHETFLPMSVSKLYPAGQQPVTTTLRQLDRDTYRVLMAPPHGAAKPVELDIPVGLPRVTNVATLKAMVGADSWDVVFRKTGDGERWAVCPDDYPVDLEDRTQLFKVREFAILS
jgi:hypothetical protein